MIRKITNFIGLVFFLIRTYFFSSDIETSCENVRNRFTVNRATLFQNAMRTLSQQKSRIMKLHCTVEGLMSKKVSRSSDISDSRHDLKR